MHKGSIVKHTIAVAFVASAVSFTNSAKGALLFTESFGSLADATAITTSNTSFTYVRSSTGLNPILEAQNPGSFTGSSLLLAATTTSLTGVGVTSATYAAFDVGQITLDVRTPATFNAANTLFIGAGTGTTFTGNGTFAGTDLTAGFQLLAGQLQHRNSLNQWVSVGAALSVATNYSFNILFNGSASLYDYGTGTMAAGTADVFINGNLFADDVSIRDAVDTSAFRIYTTSVTTGEAYEIDNVTVTSSPVPEPSSLIACLGGAALLGVFRRRR